GWRARERSAAGCPRTTRPAAAVAPRRPSGDPGGPWSQLLSFEISDDRGSFAFFGSFVFDLPLRAATMSARPRTAFEKSAPGPARAPGLPPFTAIGTARSLGNST